MTENVLLVTIDSLRYDTFLERVADRLPDDAVSFRNAYATGPGTTASFPAMLTGTLPLSYGGLGPLVDERPRVSERLGAAGLHTAGFQCNPFLSRFFNYDRGYDEFVDYQNPLMGAATRIFPRGIEINNPKLRRIDEVFHLTDAIKKSYQLVKGKPRPYVAADVVTDDALDWLDDVGDGFYGWVHYMDVHHPCFPPKPYRERYGVADVTQSEVSEWYAAVIKRPETLDEPTVEKLLGLYEAAIDYVMDQVDRLLDRLRASGRYEDTLVVLTSDHGELFGEHGEFGKPERMYDELVHVPLVVLNGPSSLADAEDDLVSLLDIPPLAHDALGLSVPAEYEGQVPGVDPPREYVMSEHEVDGDVVVSARSREWLYEADEIAGEHRLFDLRGGRFEETALSASPDAAWVRDVVADRLEELDVRAHALESEVEGDVQERLQELGYL